MANEPSLRARQSLRPGFGRVAIVLLAAACSNVPPYVERSYARLGTVSLEERLEATDKNSSGPYPGVNVALGTLLEIERTHGTALEVEFEMFDLGPGGELDGYGFRYFGGARRFWNMDGRWRPSLGVGASWTDFRLYDFQRGRDPASAGGYADVGLDWMVTPRFGLGTHLRLMARYEEADKVHGVRLGAELGLQSVWRF